MLERLTPEPDEGSCAIGVASSLRRFASSSQLATSCRVPLQGELFLFILQSANLCDTARPDTFCNQVSSNRIPSPAPEPLSPRTNSTRDHPKDSHATHHDDAVLRRDATRSLHLSFQSDHETMLAENVVVCRHRHVDRPEYD